VGETDESKDGEQEREGGVERRWGYEMAGGEQWKARRVGEGGEEKRGLG